MICTPPSFPINKNQMIKFEESSFRKFTCTTYVKLHSNLNMFWLRCRKEFLTRSLIQPILWWAQFICYQVGPHFSISISLFIQTQSQWLFTGHFPGVHISELYMQIFGIMKCRFKIIVTSQEAILNNLGNKNTRMVIHVDSCMNQIKKLLQKMTQFNIL